MHKIIDDFLPKPYFVELQNIVDSADFAWYWQDDQINGYKNSHNTFGFAHTLYRNRKVMSDVFPLIKPIVHIFEDKTKIKVKDIFRMQINLSTNTNLYNWEDANHVDIDDSNYPSFLLYLNKSDFALFNSFFKISLQRK